MEPELWGFLVLFFFDGGEGESWLVGGLVWFFGLVLGGEGGLLVFFVCLFLKGT